MPKRSALAALLLSLLAGPPAAAVRLDGSSSGYQTMVLFRDSPGEQWSVGRSRMEAAVSADRFGAGWQLRLGHTVPTGELRFGDYSGQWPAAAPGAADRFLGRVGPPRPSTDVALAARFWRRRLAVELPCRFRSTGDPDCRLDVSFSPLESIRLGLAWGRVTPDPGPIDLFYEYDDSGARARAGGRVHWWSPARLAQAEAEIAPLPHLRLRSVVRDLDFAPATPAFDGEPDGLYRACLEGSLHDGALGADWRLARGWLAAYTYRSLRLDARLQGYDGGVPWAYFGIVRGDLHQHVLSLQRGDRRLSWEWGRGDGAVQGSVKLRPFLEGLYRLLGERRHIVASGAIDWKHLALESPLVSRGCVSLRGALDWLRAEPRVEWVTWRPVLGLGIDDLRTGRWDLVRADLLRVRLLQTVRLGAVALDLDVSQWLPLSIRRAGGASAGSGAPGPADGSVSESAGGGLWSGFSFAARVRLIR
ncbi:MAG TPA: hypothetical protein PKW75_06600 [candidate division Zixibacteria bacterium]|nr:hypothetical protein [candidate division Zixibacteria bacterium]HOZ07939.1 hypothetical protein [candidate division Zixibacteria bacterium]HPM38139.1 hypothetical protein [candidate division Zixibacteria bacterium]